MQTSAALGRAVQLLNTLDARLATAGGAHRQMEALLAKAGNISGTSPHSHSFPGGAVAAD